MAAWIGLSGRMSDERNMTNVDSNKAEKPVEMGGNGLAPGLAVPSRSNVKGQYNNGLPALPLRPAWVEIDLGALAGNIRLIRAGLNPAVKLLYVLKDDAYGQGAVAAARIALSNGADELAVYTLQEGAELRQAGIAAPILLLGERLPDELSWCLEYGLTPCIGSIEIAKAMNAAALVHGRKAPVHIKINTGMNRFGFSYRDVSQWAAELSRLDRLHWKGALSHFAQSDEVDKTFARQQLGRFHEAIGQLRLAGISPDCLHMCNSGGFLDLPEAHFNMVRVGLLALGVYPSQVCRRLPGLRPVVSVKARVTALQSLDPGETVGYGMRWKAETPARIAIVPLGYGDGYPRVRNAGEVIVRGRRAPIVGGVTMDALMFDATAIEGVSPGDEVMLLGAQGADEITVQEVAALKRSVSYDILVSWRARLPRRYLAPRDE
jgi:alanine racemase